MRRSRDDRNSLDDDPTSSTSHSGGLSLTQDILLPLAIAGGPSACFAGMVLLSRIFDRGNQFPPVLIHFALFGFFVMQLVATVWIAILALVRFERGRSNLTRAFPDGPPSWRLASLFFGACFLTLADIVAVVAGLPGGGFLYLGAMIFYLIYLLLIWAAFCRSSRKGDEDDRPERI